MRDRLEEQTRLLRTVRNLFIVALAVLLIVILKMLSVLLLPLVLAILLTLVSLPLVIWLKERGVPKGIIIPIVVFITVTVVFFIVNIVTSTVADVINQQGEMRELFEAKLLGLFQIVDTKFNLNWDYSVSPLTYFIGQLDLSRLIKDFASSLGSFGSSFFLFTLYFIFLLIGVSDYRTYLQYVVGDNLSLLDNFETLQKSVATYIIIKSIISLVTAVNVYLICKISGLNFAMFWAFLAFILNFIPNIGSIIGSLCIMFIAFVQFDGYTRFLVVSLLVSLNQMIIGNVIDPIIMGYRLRLNTVTVIFGLVFWGFIWNIPGMLLSVPLMVIIKLILEQSESLGILARIMGYPEKEDKRKPWKNIWKRKKMTYKELYTKLKKIHFGEREEWSDLEQWCKNHIDLINKINKLKREKNAIIVAHTYVLPEIIYGVADYVGDSYELSRYARDSKAELIIYAAVKFMGETAKILSPDKKVIVPAEDGGCSLADSITGDDVLRLRKENPDFSFACYINTTADVKAACDVVVTSSNVYDIIEHYPSDKIYFVPDKLMGANIIEEMHRRGVNKEIRLWDGSCYVHEEFDFDQALTYKKAFPDIKILAHPECKPNVIDNSDYAGSTSQIYDYIRKEGKGRFIIFSECGLASRLEVEQSEDLVIQGPCQACKYMKSNNLENIYKALSESDTAEAVEIDENVRVKAQDALNEMFRMVDAIRS